MDIPPQHAVTLPEGLLLDQRWMLGARLGAGGFATIYEGIDRRLDRHVAIKVLEIQAAPQELAIFQERFLREAKLASQLDHPHIVHIHDYGIFTHEGVRRPFIVMERLRGHDLEHELLTHGPLERSRALKLLGGALDALAMCHAQGIIHRDLKPSNLYIVHPGTDQERLVVLDFGIARVFDDPHSKLTATNHFTGTPAYLAPEYIESQKSSPAVDVYQLGLIIAESLTGTPVVQASAPLGYLLAHCNGQQHIPEPLASQPLGQVLKRAVSVDPDARYPDAAALRRAIDAAQQALATTLPHAPTPTVSRPPARVPPTDPDSRLLDQGMPPAPPATPRGVGAAPLIILGALALLMALGAPLALLLTRQASEDSPGADAPSAQAPEPAGQAHAPARAQDTLEPAPAPDDPALAMRADALVTAPVKAPVKAPGHLQPEREAGATGAPLHQSPTGASASPSQPALAAKPPRASPSAKAPTSPSIDPLELLRPGPMDAKLALASQTWQTLHGEVTLNHRAYLRAVELHGLDEPAKVALSFSDVASTYQHAANALSKLAAASPAPALDASARALASTTRALASLHAEGYALRMSRDATAQTLRALHQRLDKLMTTYDAQRAAFAHALLDAQEEHLARAVALADPRAMPALHHYLGALLEVTRVMRDAYDQDQAPKADPHLSKLRRHLDAYDRLKDKRVHPDISSQVTSRMAEVLRSASLMPKKIEELRAASKKAAVQGGAQSAHTRAIAHNFMHMSYKIIMTRHFTRSL